MDREKVFIGQITNDVYKMLVLKEREDCGEEVYLDEYIENLFVEVNGAYKWSEYLCNDKDYVIVTSVIAYLSEHSMSFKSYRRNVFKVLNLLNRISAKVGEE